MAFDYEKINQNEESNFWASYSDLFMMMSVLFLMLYVIAQLRGGAYSIQKQKEHVVLRQEVEDLREQLRVYNALKQDHLKNAANETEKQMYAQLMDKLSLLKEETSNEKDDLRKQATENEKKEEALNHYQQMIRNIINTNMLAKSRIARRDDIIKSKESEIKSKKSSIAKLSKELNEEQKKIQQINQSLNVKISELQEAHQRNQITKKSMDSEIQRLQKQSQKKLAQLSEKEKALNSQLNSVRSQLSSTSSELGQTRAVVAQKEQLLAEKDQNLSKASAEIASAKKDLQKSQAMANARKNLAQRIRGNFQKAGIKANVDEETGEVTINFGEEYFDTGKAELKGGMKEILKKSVPVYAESLFKDPEVMKKISAVEIIGFASPTFKGKYVDPKSLSRDAQKAVSYNLDLSYKRARSIFTYIFDTDKMKYEHQKQLLPMVKVTGRSFLTEGLKDRNLASGVSQKEFCEKYDCFKAQKVIIRFNLGD